MFEFNQNERLERAQKKPWPPGFRRRPLRPIQFVEPVVKDFEGEKTSHWAAETLGGPMNPTPKEEALVEEASEQEQVNNSYESCDDCASNAFSNEGTEFGQLDVGVHKVNKERNSLVLAPLESNFNDSHVFRTYGRPSYPLIFHPDAPMLKVNRPWTIIRDGVVLPLGGRIEEWRKKNGKPVIDGKKIDIYVRFGFNSRGTLSFGFNIVLVGFSIEKLREMKCCFAQFIKHQVFIEKDDGKSVAVDMELRLRDPLLKSASKKVKTGKWYHDDTTLDDDGGKVRNLSEAEKKELKRKGVSFSELKNILKKKGRICSPLNYESRYFPDRLIVEDKPLPFNLKLIAKRYPNLIRKIDDINKSANKPRKLIFEQTFETHLRCASKYVWGIRFKLVWTTNLPIKKDSYWVTKVKRLDWGVPLKPSKEVDLITKAILLGIPMKLMGSLGKERLDKGK